MASFARKFREEPESYPVQILIIDKIDPRIVAAAKSFGLPIIVPELNNNQISSPSNPTIYVLAEFENNPIISTIKRTSQSWILGPTALEELSLDPSLEIRSQPTFCTSMYGLCFYINCPENLPLMRRTAQLIKWMGGLFVLEPDLRTTHMITTSTRAKGYVYCFTFNVPILTPQWIECCWQNRHIANFDVKSIMERFRVSAFLDLKISFIGFTSEQHDNKKTLTEAKGGTVVSPEDPDCTHLVVSSDIEKHVNIHDVPSHILYVVKEGWFLESLRSNQRVNEEDFKCFMERFRISAFLDLKISFIGFTSEQHDIKKSLTEVNGGTVVSPEDPDCTHLVVSSDIEKYVNIHDVPSHILYVVKEGWFLESIRSNQRANEERFKCFMPNELDKSLWVAMDENKTIPEPGKKSIILNQTRASLNKEG